MPSRSSPSYYSDEAMASDHPQLVLATVFILSQLWIYLKKLGYTERERRGKKKKKREMPCA